MELFIIRKEPGSSKAWLDGEEARHCIKVLRLKPGDRILGTDGLGLWLECKIVQLGRDSVELLVENEKVNVGEKPQKVGIALSVLHKPDRMEWFMEKSVELGVTDIFPFVAKRTVKTGFREDRMEKILIAGLKQCQRTRLPALHPVLDFEEVLALQGWEQKFIAQADASINLLSFQDAIAQATGVLGIVGPEGDFSSDEISAAVQAGFNLVALGKNRLRSETAALHLLGAVKLLMKY